MAVATDHLFMSSVAILLDWINNRQWAKLEKLALNDRELYVLISEHIQKCSEFNGMTLLHAAIKNNAPLRVIRSMAFAHSDALKVQDCVGRTPLHVAAGTGADAFITRLLVKAYPKACDLQDDDGRTPLHLACDAECVIFEGSQTPRGPPTIDVVQALLSGSLAPVLVEDEDDTSPIEYAIVSGADMDVVKILQKASMTIRRQIAKINKQVAADDFSNADAKPIQK